MQWVRRWLEPQDRVIERQKELDQLCRSIAVDLREDRPQDALDRLAEAWPLADKVAHADSRWQPRLIDYEGVALRALERFEDWESRLVEWRGDPDPVQRAKCEYSLAVTHLAAGRLNEARLLAQTALSAFRNFDGDHRQSLALCLGALAEIEHLRALGHPEVREAQACQALADEAIELWLNLSQTHDGFTIPPALELSRLLALIGRYPEALAAAGERRLPGRLGAILDLSLARAQLGLRHFRQAEASLHSALEVATEDSGLRSTRALSLHLLGDALRSRSDYRAAGDAYRQAAELCRTGDRWNACVAWHKALAVALVLEQPGLALFYAEQAIDLAPSGELRAIAMVNRGVTVQLTGDHALASHYYSTSLAELEQLYGPADPRLGLALIHLASAQRNLDAPDAARQTARRAQSLTLTGQYRLSLYMETALLGESFDAVRAALPLAPADIEVAEDLDAHAHAFEQAGRRAEAEELRSAADALRHRLAAG